MGPFKITGFLCFALILALGSVSAHNTQRADLSKFTSADERREFVRLMIQQSWKAYSVLAWGQESIHPVAPSEHLNDTKSGETIFGSLSTLWIADLKDEFAAAKDWLQNELNIQDAILSDKHKANQLYTYIGPLLSAFVLSQDQFFLNKAVELAQIDSVFEPPGLDEVVRHGLIEYQLLTDLTGNVSYIGKVQKYQERLWGIEKNRAENFYLNGYPYEVEVRRSIQSNGTYNPAEQLAKYRSVLDSALQSGLITRFENWTTYHNLPFYQEMLYSHCNLGSNLIQGARLWSQASPQVPDSEKERITRDEEFADEITQFCYEVSRRTATHLPAYKFTFNNETQQVEYQYTRYEIAPELAESYFALYRQTKDPKYRDQAWELVSAIYEYARFSQGAYGSVNNVQKIPTVLDDYQPIRALSGTFKYLYLIFSDDDLLPTDSWLFNADGHPLPICGQLPVYPDSVCKKQQSGSSTTEKPN